MTKAMSAEEFANALDDVESPDWFGRDRRHRFTDMVRARDAVIVATARAELLLEEADREHDNAWDCLLWWHYYSDRDEGLVASKAEHDWREHARLEQWYRRRAATEAEGKRNAP